MGTPPTVLVVDDEPDVCEYVRRLLTRADVRVVVGIGFREGLRLVAEHPDDIQLLLTDLRMPGGSGAELAALARLYRPGISVLYMSGLVSWHPTVLELGPKAAVLEKPFLASDLLDGVSRLLPAVLARR